jgi:hypothetical protein
MAVDLSDLWHASEELKKCINELLTMRFPRDQEQLRDLLLLMDPLIIRHFQWHVTQLKRRKNALLRALPE